MPDPAIAQVEDLIAAVGAAYGPLAGETILVDQNGDIALEDDQLPASVIAHVQTTTEPFESTAQTLHTATIKITRISKQSSATTVSRADYTALAHWIAALAADRTLGGQVQDVQEQDIAPEGGEHRDVAAASLLVNVQFFTSRGDWFTLI